MTAAVARAQRIAAERNDALRDAVTPGFLQLMRWDPAVCVLWFPASHPLFGAPVCRVSGCDKLAHNAGSRGLCRGCVKRWEKSGLTVDEFVAVVKPRSRAIGSAGCLVPDCARPCKAVTAMLCHGHWDQHRKHYSRMPVDEFVRLPNVGPLLGFGPCEVVACYRDRDIAASPYCNAHNCRRRYAIRHGTMPDEEIWRLVTPAVAEQGAVSLRGLPEQVVAEILYGVQQRNAEGIKQKDFVLRPLVDFVRVERLSSLEQLEVDRLNSHCRPLAAGLRRHVVRFGASPETERYKDVWDAAVFGLGGVFRFDHIRQTYLREALKTWALDDIPRRYGNSPRGVVQRQINNMALFSTSLRLHRNDKGMDLRLLGRDDMVFFLHRLRFLHEQDELSASRRLDAARDVRRLLNRMRTLGLTQPGQPLHGIADDFTLREEDMPEDAEDDEAGKDLPPEVMRQICEHLTTLDSTDHQHYRTVVEVVIDTRRRPTEVCKLPWDCLDRDADGKPVLVYNNRKALRMGRRLPIPEPTAAVITAQQERTRVRFPEVPIRELALFPTFQANPHGHQGDQRDECGGAPPEVGDVAAARDPRPHGGGHRRRSRHQDAALRQGEDLPLRLPAHLCPAAR
ncbi:hypothetical protein [Streptomyces coelicoflavus]|uniref:hypothetical protein n=1 Tax=Streptomyces coelicoflavus TaxID=285562 RepID=UPI000D58D600|nr:hypothetical protein [Streptomyces coelicoflavus]